MTWLVADTEVAKEPTSTAKENILLLVGRKLRSAGLGAENITHVRFIKWQSTAVMVIQGTKK